MALPTDLQEKYFMLLTDEEREEKIRYHLSMIHRYSNRIIEKTMGECNDISLIAEQTFLHAFQHNVEEKAKWVIYGKYIPRLIQFLVDTYKLVPVDELMGFVEKKLRNGFDYPLEVETFLSDLEFFLKNSFRNKAETIIDLHGMSLSYNDKQILLEELNAITHSIQLRDIINHFIYEEKIDSILEVIVGLYPKKLHIALLKSRYLNLCQKNRGHMFKYQMVEQITMIQKGLKEIDSFDFLTFFDNCVADFCILPSKEVRDLTIYCQKINKKILREIPRFFLKLNETVPDDLHTINRIALSLRSIQRELTRMVLTNKSVEKIEAEAQFSLTSLGKDLHSEDEKIVVKRFLEVTFRFC